MSPTSPPSTPNHQQPAPVRETVLALARLLGALEADERAAAVATTPEENKR